MPQADEPSQGPRKRKKVRRAPRGDGVPSFADPAATATTTITSASTATGAPEIVATITAPPASLNQRTSVRSSAIGPPPPAVPEPSSPEATQQYLPPHLAHLAQEYRFAIMSIQTSSKMEHKIKALIRHMSEFCFLQPDLRPGVVLLHAKGPAVGKLASVVEITKREVTKMGHKCWQYNRITGHKVERKEPKSKQGKEDVRAAMRKKWGGEVAPESGPGETEAQDDVSMSDDGFDGEPPAKPSPVHELAPVRPKMKTVPTMMVYMSRVAVPSFKEEFGYARSSYALP